MGSRNFGPPPSAVELPLGPPGQNLPPGPDSVSAKASARHAALSIPTEGKGAVRRYLTGLGVPETKEEMLSMIGDTVGNVATMGLYTPTKRMGTAVQQAMSGHPMDAINTFNPMAPVMSDLGDENYAGVAGQATIPIASMAIGAMLPKAPIGTPIFGEASAATAASPSRAGAIGKAVLRETPLIRHFVNAYDLINDFRGSKSAARPVVGYNMYDSPVGPPRPLPEKPPVNNPLNTVWAGKPSSPPEPLNGPALDAYSRPPAFQSPVVPGMAPDGIPIPQTATTLGASPAAVTRAAITQNSALGPSGEVANPEATTPATAFTNQALGVQNQGLPPFPRVGFSPEELQALMQQIAMKDTPPSGGGRSQSPKGNSSIEGMKRPSPNHSTEAKPNFKEHEAPFTAPTKEELAGEFDPRRLSEWRDSKDYQAKVRERPKGWRPVVIDKTQPRSWDHPDQYISQASTPLHPEEMALVQDAVSSFTEKHPHGARLISRVVVKDNFDLDPLVRGLIAFYDNVFPGSQVTINLQKFRNHIRVHGINEARGVLIHEITHGAQNFLSQPWSRRSNVPYYERSREISAFRRESKSQGYPAISSQKIPLSPKELKQGRLEAWRSGTRPPRFKPSPQSTYDWLREQVAKSRQK